MRTLFALLVLAALSACGPRLQLIRPDASPEAMAQDRLECDYEAEKVVANIRNSFEAGWTRSTIRDKCLEVRGWKWAK